MENHYLTLNLNENATSEQIKSAYISLMKKYHPDLYQGDKVFAEEMSTKINNAYTILSCEKTKQDYDEKLKTSKNIKKQIISQKKTFSKKLEKESFSKKISKLVQKMKSNKIVLSILITLLSILIILLFAILKRIWNIIKIF